MSLRPLVALVLVCALTVPACADSIAAYTEAGKGFLVMNGDAGLKVQRLPHAFVNGITVTSRLAYVQANDGHFLYGLTAHGLISKKLEGWVNGVKLGDDLAVVEQDGHKVIHGLTAASFITEDISAASEIRVAGRFAIVLFPSAPLYSLYGVAGNRIVSTALLRQPTAVGHDVLTYDEIIGKGLVALGPDGFHAFAAGDATSVGPSPGGNFQQLHAGSR